MSFWISYSIVFLLAIVPALAWMYLFLKQHKENRWVVLMTFLAGMLAAKVILIYQGYWDTTINLIFFKISFLDFRVNINGLIVNTIFAAFVTFLSVGAMEEFLKFGMMRMVTRRFFRSIDDVITFAIVSALGFAFLENMIYFMSQWGYLGTKTFLLFAISRVTIVTMVHVLCSGVLGYYAGMAFFASPVLALQHAKRKRHPVLEFLNRVLHLKKTQLYHDEMLLIGLVLSMFLHAMYDFLLFSELNISPALLVFVMLAYFFGGFWYLSYLLKRKDLNIKMGLIDEKMIPKKRLAELVGEVEHIRMSRKESRFKK